MGVLSKPIPFGNYFLLEKLNTGGMAEVYKAKTFGVEGFERIVAVKKILPAIAEDKEFVSMFIDEAKIAVQLNHANIAQIFDLGNINDEYYIALEYVPGHDLRMIFDRCVRNSRRLDIGCVCYIVSKICEGLDFAHNKVDANGEPMNIIHRDISPQNILLSYEGDCKLIDFGIAKATNKSSATQVGILKGKFSYMSPEQVSGKSNIDRRSDVFALGIVLFEMLTLKRLFVGASDFETLEKIRKVEVSPPTLYNSDIPEELEDIVLKALEKDVSSRYQSASELQDALQRFMMKQGIYYTAKDLSEFMHSMFMQEITLEQKKREYYKELTRDVLVQPTTLPVEEETSFYQRGSMSVLNGAPAMSGAQYEPVSGQPAPKQAIYAELDGFEPPKADIVFSNKSGNPQGGENIQDIISASVVGASSNKPSRRKAVSADPVPAPVMVKGRETVLALPSTPRQRNSKGFKGIVIALLLVILFLGVIAIYRTVFSKNGVVNFKIDPEVAVMLSIDGRDAQKVTKSLIPVRNLSTKNATQYRIEAEGYEPVEGSVTASEDGQNVTISLKPVLQTKIKLYVDVEMAEVTLDGKPLSGNQDFELSDIMAGDHLIVVKKDGYKPVEKIIQIKDGEQQNVTIKLEPAFAILLVKAEPYDAHFELRNLRTGETRKGIATLAGQRMADLPIDDEYAITLIDGSDKIEHRWQPNKNTQPNHEQVRVFTTKFNPNAARAEEKVAADTPAPAPTPAAPKAASKPAAPKASTSKSKAKSEAAAAPAPAKKEDESKPAPAPAGNVPGIMQIASKPPCNIIINGKDYGTTPKKIELPAGSYKIKFVNAEQGINAEQSVTLGAGEVKKVMRK